MTQTLDLTGKILIAMPGIGDPRFEFSVIFICSHSEDGTMGIIINKPAEELDFDDLLDQLSIEKAPDTRRPDIHFGGPVEMGRGFVLHSGDYQAPEGTMDVAPDFALTASLEVLEDIAQGVGPERAILALGYAGWGPGQLEDEILANGWLTADADVGMIFSADAPGKWAAALGQLGIDPMMLSAAAGHA